MSPGQPLRLTVNGSPVEREVPAGQLLIDFLRESLELTASKEACGVGVCGLCAVLIDGRLVSGCLLPAVCAAGRDVWTLEGLTAAAEGRSAGPEPPAGGLMRAVQAAFLECEGLQCGICTPGQVMSAYALLRETPRPDEDEIRHFMAGSLCRCTGYDSIVRSIRLAAERWAERAGL